MLNYEQMEFLTYERQRGFLAEAEARRLANTCVASWPSLSNRIQCWVGSHLIHWGSMLQGQTAQSPLSIHDDPQPLHQS